MNENVTDVLKLFQILYISILLMRDGQMKCINYSLVIMCLSEKMLHHLCNGLVIIIMDIVLPDSMHGSFYYHCLDEMLGKKYQQGFIIQVRL